MSEKKLYGPVRDLFKSRDYFVVCDMKGSSPFSIRLDGVERRVDVTAVRWEDDAIRSVGVECKSGDSWVKALEALPQALFYWFVFDEVYIATRRISDLNRLESIHHLKSVLEPIGVGFIEVDGSRAHIVIPAKPSAPLQGGDEELMKRNVERKAKVILTFAGIFGDESVRVGRANRPYEVWVSSDKTKSYNFFMHLHPKNEEDGILEDELHMGVNAEKKEVIKKFVKRVSAQNFYGELSRLPQSYYLLLWYVPKRGVGELVLREQVGNCDRSRVKECFEEIEDRDCKVCLQVARIIPAKELDGKSREDMEGLFRGVQGELGSLFNLIRNAVESKIRGVVKSDRIRVS